MSTEKIFAKGFLFKRKENAPDFVVGSLSLKLSEAIPFIQEHANCDWVNLDVIKSKGGNIYVELNTYVKPTQTTNANEDISSDLAF